MRFATLLYPAPVVSKITLRFLFKQSFIKFNMNFCLFKELSLDVGSSGLGAISIAFFSTSACGHLMKK